MEANGDPECVETNGELEGLGSGLWGVPVKWCGRIRSRMWMWRMCQIDSELVVNLMPLPWLDLQLIPTKSNLLQPTKLEVVCSVEECCHGGHIVLAPRRRTTSPPKIPP